MIGVHVRPWRPGPAAPLLGMGAAGAAATTIVLASPALSLTAVLQLPAPGRMLLLASALALALAVLLAPLPCSRWELLAIGLAGLGGEALLMAAADPLLVAVLLVLLGFAQAALPGRLPFAVRARGPAFGALLLGLGWTFVRTGGGGWQDRAGALALALGLVAAAGLLPYLSEADPEEPRAASFAAWTAFFGPALAVTLPARVLQQRGLGAEAGGVFEACLIALGLVNLLWGVVAAWRTASDAAAWRYSFLMDWGLALVGIGVLQPDGTAGAYLALLSIVAVRLPLSLWARPGLAPAHSALMGSGTAPRPGPAMLVAAVLLAGSAPFAGFPVRLLVLHAATQLSWPLAVPLLVAMLLGVLPAVRLARTLGAPRGRALAGLWVTLGLGLVLGLGAGAVRALGGL